MDIRKIKKLIELIEDTGVTEIEIKEGEESVRLSKKSNSVQHISHTPSVPLAHTTTAHTPEGPPATESTSSQMTDTNHTIKAPIVGTFYTAPSPDAKVFVQIGQKVKSGDVLCIIEAMKMFNEIETDVSGIVKACLVDNEQPVEFGQPLFLIEEDM